MKFYVPLTATEATTADGQPLVRGGEIDLKPEQRDDPFNTRLIAEGQLIGLASPDKTRAEASDRMSRDAAPDPLLPVVPPLLIPNSSEGGAVQ